MIPLEVLGTLFAASVVLALVPGPDDIFVLTQSALHGRSAGMFVTMGLCAGLLVHTAAVSFGVAARPTRSSRSSTGPRRRPSTSCDGSGTSSFGRPCVGSAGGVRSYCWRSIRTRARTATNKLPGSSTSRSAASDRRGPAACRSSWRYWPRWRRRSRLEDCRAAARCI